jgi:hypothetical protein
MSVDDVFGLVNPSEGGGGGDFTRRFKMDAKDGFNAVIKREQNADGDWEDSEQRLDFPHNLHIDMANMEVTWSKFEGGRDVIGTKLRDILDGSSMLPKAPSKEYKDGIRVFVSNKALFEEPFREILQNSFYAKEAFKQLYKDFQKDAASHEDEVPVVTFSKPIAKTTKMGKVNPPNMQITSWTSRDAFDGATATSRPSGKSVF